jgi:hypothetical protein
MAATTASDMTDDTVTFIAKFKGNTQPITVPVATSTVADLQRQICVAFQLDVATVKVMGLKRGKLPDPNVSCVWCVVWCVVCVVCVCVKALSVVSVSD